MIRIGIVADDLSGAADTALQFVRAGWQTELQLLPGPSTAQVLALTTDSRGLAAPDAAKAAGVAVKQLCQVGVAHLYKKIDSTLRGHLRAELQAAMDAWSPAAIAVVCPAFPAMGRTVVGGRLLLNGVPVSETALARDPVTPVTESHLPTLLAASHVASNAADSAQTLAERIRACAPMVVVDAADDEQLQRLAEAVVLLGSHAISVGSAGLASQLARAWSPENVAAFRSSSQSSVVKEVGGKARITIVIVTSLQEVARRQAAAVAVAGAVHGEPGSGDLIDDDAWKRWSTELLGRVGNVDGTDATLLLTAPVDLRKELPPDLIPNRFSDLAARIIKRAGVDVSGVVVTGGDGARAVAHALGATGFQIYGEVTGGVPMGTLVGGQGDGLRFVTKAGGFGPPETLTDAVAQLKLRPTENQLRPTENKLHPTENKLHPTEDRTHP
jgi:uncharacterized protein YgbK (DUF1537 family)